MIFYRFQRSRYWTKDQNSSDWRGEDHDRPRVRSEIRDYEIDDHRTFDYEKDEDDIDEALGPKINDWGLEVEEEEERMLHLEKQQSLPDPKESARGVIRLPPDAMSSSSGTTTTAPAAASAPGVVASGSSSSDWRARPRDQPSSNHSHHSHSHQVSRSIKLFTKNSVKLMIFHFTSFLSWTFLIHWLTMQKEIIFCLRFPNSFSRIFFYI